MILFFTWWLYVRSCYKSFPQTSGGFDVALTTIPALQTKRLRKRANHLHTTCIRIWKQTQNWIIPVPYASVNSEKTFFPWATNFFLNKIQSNNLNLDYPDILTDQIDFCFLKVYFSSLIRTKIECINKQSLININ